MTETAILAARLESALGSRHVLTFEEERREYAADGVTPGVVVRPQSAEEVAELVRFARSDGLGVIASGSHSKLEIGMPPQRYDIAVDLREMAEIAHYDAGDMTLSVDAGIGLRELKNVLAEKRQFLPLAVPCFDSGTVGGAVASGIDSVLRQQYGTVRDFLIGAEFVDGKGSRCKSGGRVVKNVTGYDLHKLLVGSLGTLGVITRLNFRTFPMPPASGACFACFSELDRAIKFRTQIQGGARPLANLELMNAEFGRQATALLEKEVVAPPAAWTEAPWSVYVSIEGHETVVRRVLRDVAQLSKTCLARSFDSLEPDGARAVNRVLREAYAWLRWAAPGVALFRIVVPGFNPVMMQEMDSLLRAETALRGAFSMRAANAAYWTILAENQEPATVNILGAAANRVFAIAAANGGFATLLHAPPLMKDQVSVWGPRRDDSFMMQRIKAAFDPQNILAPGRFAGGF